MDGLLCPELPLPEYAFRPGQNTHPNKPGGHSHNLPEPEVSSTNAEELCNCREHLHAVDLLLHGYYWEAHVWWEALWNAHNRQGELADLFKGLIKLAAAGLKLEISQTQAARGHLERARDLLSPLEQSFPKGIEVWPQMPLQRLLDHIGVLIQKQKIELPLNQGLIQLTRPGP